MRAFTVLLALTLALGCSQVTHAARPSFLQPEFYGSLARFLLTQLEVDYGLTPEQADVITDLYGGDVPETEAAIKEDFATGALEQTVSEATPGQPAIESLNVLNSLLYAKAGEGDTPAVEDLLAVDADPNAAVDGDTPLLAALLIGRSGVVGVLVSGGADTNRPGSDGETPLLVAIGNASLSSAEELLDGGANPNLADSDGNTPLLAALAGPYPDIVNLLLEHGADVNLPGPSGDTPFQTLLQSSPIDADLVKAFISSGADVNSPDPDGLTPLDLAAGNDDITALLIAAGAVPGPDTETVEG